MTAKHAIVQFAKPLAVAALLCGFALCARASGTEQLKAFVDGTKSARTRFVQTVVAGSARAPVRSEGSFMFARPGKFRWSYEKPYEQLIVGDGEKLWIYDKDLNQVTVKKLGQALGSSPAALLAGDNAMEKNFALKDAGSAGGLEWVEALPKQQEGTFQRVRLGLKDNLPRVMELVDSFGQRTTLEFGQFERNPGLPANTFRFVPPKGADVIGD